MKYTDNFMKVTTLMQIKFHLENGKIIFVKLSDGFGYFSKEKDMINFTYQPILGTATVLCSKYEKFDSVYEKFKTMEFFVADRDNIGKRDSSIFDKIADKFRKYMKGESL